MVAYLEKSEGSEGFHEIIDFLSVSHIHYALTASPTIYTSLIEQFWQTAALCIIDDGVMGITATIDRKLTDRIGVLEKDLQQTKKTYSTALTRLILRVEKLEKNVKTCKDRRRARIVISKDEDAAKDSSKQGRKIFDIDIDPTISLVQPQQDMEYDFDATASIPITTVGLEISTADAAVTTVSVSISIVSPLEVSTAEDISGAKTLVYIRRSASKVKDKGKAIMQESEPLNKIKKRVQVQMGIDEELAKRVFKEEQAKTKAEQEQQKFDFETTLELQRQLDKREEVAAKEAHDIDWSDPPVLRYHALQN
ncbi:hypothetical protein Tco_0909493 [Tanacetum coccineum]|uniref:Xylulose kinase-1 n=1 Tax=Tanacetum coccineum TaxID=301880 RepID=A0ABQ5CTF3_9ASTR